MDKEKVILHLCCDEDIASDSKPYRDAGYKVKLIGKNIGVENYTPYSPVYGIIANPPCTQFSFARTNAKKPRDLREGMMCVRHCLRIIWHCQYRLYRDTQKKAPLKFWVLENPDAMLRWFLGKPAMIYNPFNFGENYQKKTCLWGMFNEPKYPNGNLLRKKPVKFDYMRSKDIHPEYFGKISRNRRRSICSPEFAKAFFEANK